MITDCTFYWRRRKSKAVRQMQFTSTPVKSTTRIDDSSAVPQNLGASVFSLLIYRCRIPTSGFFLVGAESWEGVCATTLQQSGWVSGKEAVLT